MVNVLCGYCGWKNPDGTERCQACGAPLEYTAATETRVSVIEEAPPPYEEQLIADTLPATDTLQEGLKAAGLAAGAVGVGSVLLRVAAQGFAIAFSSFVVGFSAGATAASPYEPSRIHLLTAIIGGALLGIVIPLVRKRSIWTLLAAPLGSVTGLLVSNYALSMPGRSMPWAAQLSLGFALLFAVIGGKRSRGVPVRCLRALQPVLGGIGGVLFALAGYIVKYNLF